MSSLSLPIPAFSCKALCCHQGTGQGGWQSQGCPHPQGCHLGHVEGIWSKQEYELKATQHDTTETGAKCKYQMCVVIRNTDNHKDKMFSLHSCPVVGWQRAHIAARLSSSGSQSSSWVSHHCQKHSSAGPSLAASFTSYNEKGLLA